MEVAKQVTATQLRLGETSEAAQLRSPPHQNQKEIAMRKQALRTVSVLSLLFMLTAASTHAQSAKTIDVTIPFEFNVAGKLLPAGEYIVRRATQNTDEGWQVLRKDGGAGAFFLTMYIQAGVVNENSRLVFNRYDDQYFLSQIWTAGNSDARGLAKSPRERSLDHEIAKKGAECQTVAIIGRRP
jgi:hypothetical protein